MSRSTQTHNSTRDDEPHTLDAVTSVTDRIRDGSIAMLVGGILLARAVLSRNRGRAVMQAGVGVALLAFGRHRYRSETDTVEERIEYDTSDDSPAQGDDEQDERSESEDDEQDERSESEDDEQDERSESEDDDQSPQDPRLDDETTDVDLSSASVADEASEATGPAPEQAQPTQTEATEPESTPEEDNT